VSTELRRPKPHAGALAWIQSLGHTRLRVENVTLVYPATSKEAVIHHGVGKQKNEANQDG
jgi:hypothetical protein